VIDVFVDYLDLADLGFAGIELQSTSRLSDHPPVLVKLHVYGYLSLMLCSRAGAWSARRTATSK
jgi:hypothetical protein